eukprot:jgi/Mesvir1/3242/Mv16384-RA.1
MREDNPGKPWHRDVVRLYTLELSAAVLCTFCFLQYLVRHAPSILRPVRQTFAELFFELGPARSMAAMDNDDFEEDVEFGLGGVEDAPPKDDKQAASPGKEGREGGDYHSDGADVFEDENEEDDAVDLYGDVEVGYNSGPGTDADIIPDRSPDADEVARGEDPSNSHTGLDEPRGETSTDDGGTRPAGGKSTLDDDSKKTSLRGHRDEGGDGVARDRPDSHGPDETWRDETSQQKRPSSPPAPPPQKDQQQRAVTEKANGPQPSDRHGQISLFVGELQWWTTDAELEKALSEFGKVKNLRFFEERVNAKSKGYAQCFKANQGSHQAAHVYRVRHFRAADGTMHHRRMTDEEWAEHQRQRDNGHPAGADAGASPAKSSEASAVAGASGGEPPAVTEMRKSMEELRINSPAEAVQLLKASHDVNEIVAANDFLVASAKAANAAAHAAQQAGEGAAPGGGKACTVFSELLDGDVAGAWHQLLSASRTLFDSTGKTFDQVPITHARDSCDAAWHAIFAHFAKQEATGHDGHGGSHAATGCHAGAQASKSGATGTSHRPTSGGTHRSTPGSTGAATHGGSGGSIARTTSGGTSGAAPRRQSSIGKSAPGKHGGVDETKRNEADVLLPTLHVAALVAAMPPLAKMKQDPASVNDLSAEDEDELIRSLGAVLEPRMPMSDVHPPPRVRDWIESDDATKGAQALRRIAKHARAVGDTSAAVKLLMGAALMYGEDAGADLKKTVKTWRDECKTFFEARHAEP